MGGHPERPSAFGAVEHVGQRVARRRGALVPRERKPAAGRARVEPVLGYSRNGNDWQFHGRNGAIGNDSTHCTFARLDQTTLSLNTRLNFTATPNLSFQFYGEPFVSNGTYADLKEIRDARADAYASRFKPYGSGSGMFDGFSYRQFNSHAVLRYEYRPGSSLFMVWQQGRNSFLTRADAEYQVGRDYAAALRDHPNNTFLIKLSYWINP